MNKIKLYIVAHKIMSAFVLIIVASGGYYIHQKLTSTAGETDYVMSKVTRGTLISSVTGSGQVAASSQIDLKSKVSGTLTYVGVQAGDKVGSGRLLFSIDNTDALKAVRDAEVNLQTAQIALSKLQVQDSSVNLDTNLAKAYDDGFSAVSNSFLDLPGIMNGLDNMFFKSTISTINQLNIDWYQGQVSSDDSVAVIPLKQNFTDAYNTALTSYTDNFNNYKSVSRTSDNATIEKLISQTYDTVKLISNAIKSANNYIDFVSNSIQKRNTNTPPAIIASNQATLNNYTAQTNSHLQDLLSIETQIQSNKDSYTNSTLDAQSQQLSVQQKQNALQDAKDNLADYSILAPFSGTIASVPIEKGNNISSGTILGSIITTQQTATISLNEVDIAKISLGQKVTLTFDAVPDLTISGKVIQIDSVGTVTQGVVNYNVKISFDTYDTRVKPGMTVNAAIITDVKQNVLMTPNSAVKSSNGTNYVEMFNTPLPAPLPGAAGSPSKVAPVRQAVTIGISNDTSTEIISGVNEGDEVVSRTILPSSTTATTAPSIFGSPARSSGSTVRTQPGR